MLHSIHTYANVEIPWMTCIKQILIECGFSGVWTSHFVYNEKWFVCRIKQKLKDLFSKMETGFRFRHTDYLKKI